MSTETEIFSTALQSLNDGRRAVLATVVAARGSVPRGEGSKLLFLEDGRIVGSVGGGVVEATVIERCHQVIQTGQPERVHLDISGGGALDAKCGGVLEVFLDPLGPRFRLIVAGAGHVGLAVARLAKAMGGFSVVLVDDREEPLPQDSAPAGCARVHEDLAVYLRGQCFSPQDAIVIVTRGHRLDEEALSSVVGREAGYVGMIGSRAKVTACLAALEAGGASREAMDRIYAPIGLHIGAETPEELAVCIMAEILAVLRGTSGGHCKDCKK